MMRHKIYAFTLLLVLSMLTACLKFEDDTILYIPEGESVAHVDMTFQGFTPSLSTRSAGDAIQAINSLQLFIYDAETNAPVEIKGHFPLDISDFQIEAPETEEPNRSDYRVSFDLRLPNGKYRMYALANMQLDGSAAQSEDDLFKAATPEWDADNAANNAEMFGRFDGNDGESASSGKDATGLAPVVSIGGSADTDLHVWLRRCASKVTVAFDGSGLKEGVSIYLKKLRICNIPVTCTLGVDNTASETVQVIARGEEVDYNPLAAEFDASYPALLCKDHPFYPAKEPQEDGTLGWPADKDPHADNSPNSLFFYENMQGEGPDKRQDANSDGTVDQLFPYKEKPYATYIEVETYYVSSAPEHPGICNITYRFMLGQDVIQDYNAARNCHYKLTLKLKGYADEPDWRIEYVTRLWATQPEVVDYRGKYFVPDTSIPNEGDTFEENNYITVTSFMYERDSWSNRKAMPYKTEYREAGSDQFTETRPNWLGDFTTTHKGNGVYELKINYNPIYDEVNLNTLLSENETKGEGETGPYDLATKGDSKNKANTANCYIVDSKGTYTFPLVYGNGITDGSEIEKAYKYIGWGTGDNYLTTFKNYKNEDISSVYILDDIYGSTDQAPAEVSASLLWQDEPKLIESVEYKKDLYDHGGIQFKVGSNIKEGNAVIALKDKDGAIMWSWHIWVTSIDFSQKVTLINDAGQRFDILPVNLGWCSGGTPIRYYYRHECEVRFTQILDNDTQEGVSAIVKIIQEPHIALPQGNNPYFQWGRKDPFVAAGTGVEEVKGSDNKTYWVQKTKKWYKAGSADAVESNPKVIGVDEKDNPIENHPIYTGKTEEEIMPGIFNEDETPATKTVPIKKPTREVLAELIKNPDQWWKCRHKYPGEWGNPYMPNDATYFNLWDNSNWNDSDVVVKTIYDPCPAGYHVSSIFTFSGFTVGGGEQANSTTIQDNMYAATERNMMEGVYKTNIFEFYTDKTKLISLGFPQNGYRDWDDNANLLTVNTIGQIWSAQAVPFDWAIGPFIAYYFEFSRYNQIRPTYNFYATDGFAVRPAITLTE